MIVLELMSGGDLRQLLIGQKQRQVPQTCCMNFMKK